VPEFTLDPLTAAPGRRPSGARLYHRGSVFSEPARCRMDRAHAWRLLAHAEALERDTRAPGKHGGCLKDSGLKVLRALLRHFYSYRHGTCFPSYEAIARAAGCCVETVRKAIRRLESAGILSTIRRKIVTSFVSRGHRVRFDVAVQTSNSYTFNAPGGRPNAQPVPDPQQKATETAASEADAKFRRETSERIKSKGGTPIASLIQPRQMPAEEPETDLNAEKARWIAALLSDSAAG
jgi:Helix-turn-helix domain